MKKEIPKNPATIAWTYFTQYAKEKGYNKKIPGDMAYINTKGKTMRLKETMGTSVIVVWEEGKGIYSVMYDGGKVE
jgi:hypothetical protein